MSDDLDQKVTHETPTVRAPGTASYEDLEKLTDSEGDVVKVCKSCTASAPWDAEFCPDCGDELVSVRKQPDMYLNETVGDRYTITEKIGEGGMGVVYLGVNESVGQKVAVKFLNKRFANDEGIVRRFINEARSYCRVSHPNAVTLHDYGQHDDDALYIITEFVEGRNLTQTLQESGPLPADVALDVSIQIAEVLSAAHHEGIIHRDLKPDNVMLMPSPRGRYAVKVLDFGIAKIVDDEDGPNTETGSVFGTPEFMSPEQARGDEADPRSDIYALGVIMFYMLTGKLPFRGKNKLVVLNKQLNEAPPRPSEMLDDIDVPPRFESVIMKCLNKGRLERYDSADDLLEALEELRIPGGQDTDKVGVSGLEVTPALGELRQSTVRLGEAEEQPDPHADTLAAPLGADHDEPAPMDLESIEMWREQGADSAPPTRSTHRPAVVAVVGGFIVVAVALVISLQSSGGDEVDVEGAVMTAHADGMLSVAEGMIAEGHLDAAKSALTSTRDWEKDEPLAAAAKERRDELSMQIAQLEKLRKVFAVSVDDSDCTEATEVHEEIAALSAGLARDLEKELHGCRETGDPVEAPEQPAPAEEPDPVVTEVAQPDSPPEPSSDPVRPEEQPAEERPSEQAPSNAGLTGAEQAEESTESETENETAEEALPPETATPQPDPPVLSAEDEQDEEGGDDAEEAGEEAQTDETAGEEVPDGMALPPRQIDE